MFGTYNRKSEASCFYEINLREIELREIATSKIWPFICCGSDIRGSDHPGMGAKGYPRGGLREG